MATRQNKYTQGLAKFGARAAPHAKIFLRTMPHGRVRGPSSRRSVDKSRSNPQALLPVAIVWLDLGARACYNSHSRVGTYLIDLRKAYVIISELNARWLN